MSAKQARPPVARAAGPAPRAGADNSGRRRSGHHAPELPVLAMATESVATRAAVAMLAGLAALSLLRAWATFVPGMTTWGLNHTRFVGPVFGWPLWGLAVLALLPWLARPLTPGLQALGDFLVHSPRAAAALAASGGGLLVLSLPDNARFVGDFLLRQGTVELAGRPGILFPQALPLDVYLHVSLPTWMMESGWLDANGAARAIGAVEAALLAALAVALPRVLALRGAAAVAVAAVVWWSGALSMFTGYSKAFGELAVLATAAGVFAIRSQRDDAPPLGLGIVLAIGLVLHRSALGLLPVWLAVWVSWGWRRGRAGGWRYPRTWVALAIPLAVLVAMLPKIVATFLRWDSVHLAPADVVAGGGPWHAALAGHRPMDLANLLLVLAPVLPAMLAALLAFGRGLPRRREALLLAALVLPLTAIIPFIHPAQGMFRDWDDFASGAAALAVASAWLAGEVLRAAPRFSWLALPLALGAAAPSLQWLAVQNDLGRALQRAEAIATGPPRRTGPEWGNTWDYLGIRNYRALRWEASARAFGNAAMTSPSPRILLQWGLAESKRGDHRAAQRVYRQLVRRNPDDFTGWSGYASASAELNDAPAAREAAAAMLRIRPDDRNAVMLLESIAEYEQRHQGKPKP